jgi:hypothetical protein
MARGAGSDDKPRDNTTGSEQFTAALSGLDLGQIQALAQRVLSAGRP